MSRKFWDNPDIIKMKIPPDNLFLQWYRGNRARVYAHKMDESGIAAIPLTGVMKAENAKQLIEDYELAYKTKDVKLINPIEKYDIN